MAEWLRDSIDTPEIVSNPEDLKQQKRIGTTMQGLAWLVALVLGYFFFQELLDKQKNPNQSLNTHYSESGAAEVHLKRNKYGHYVTSGAINGKPVTFLLDTGATGIAIPAGVADRLGLKRGRSFPVRTANGNSVSYAVNLDTVNVGEIMVRDVPAGITPAYKAEEVLLGMSFLKHVEFTQRGDTLILRR